VQATDPIAVEPEDFSLFGLLENFAYTLLCCGGLLWFGLQSYSGPVAGLIVFLAAPWLFYSALRFAIRPAERKWRGARLALWLCSITAVVVAQNWYAYAARQNAEEMVVKVRAYRTAKGAWPRRLEDLGLDSAQALRESGLRYATPEGQARLTYRSTWTPMDYHSYDFAGGTWTFVQAR
jgi:hypothetical protein